MDQGTARKLERGRAGEHERNADRGEIDVLAVGVRMRVRVVERLAVVGDQRDEPLVERALETLEEPAHVLVDPRHLRKVERTSGERVLRIEPLTRCDGVTHPVDRLLPAIDRSLVVAEQLALQRRRSVVPRRVRVVVVDEQEERPRRVASFDRVERAVGHTPGVVLEDALLGRDVVVDPEATGEPESVVEDGPPHDRDRVPASGGEPLGQERWIPLERVAIPHDPVSVRIESREERGVGVERRRRLRERPLEPHAARGERVRVRRPRVRRPRTHRSHRRASCPSS